MDFEIKYAKSKQQIASEYGVCTKTLNKWLKEEKISIKRGLIKPKQQLLIYRKLGSPKNSV
jgi:phage antirepressor YoqD-like protein